MIKTNPQSGFTLIELLVVIAIIGLLAGVVLLSLQNVREKAKRINTISQQSQLSKTIEIYSLDVGFYPPDVSRGSDPGISQPLPRNNNGTIDCNIDESQCACPGSPIVNCGLIGTAQPNDWIDMAKQKWRGPYVGGWPKNHPWGGLYDYNYFPNGDDARGIPPCPVGPGIYVSAESVSIGSAVGGVPAEQEQWFINNGFDSDKCVNTETTFLLQKL